MGKVTITEWEIRYRNLVLDTEEWSDKVVTEFFYDDEEEAREVFDDLRSNEHVYTDVRLMRRTVVRHEDEWEEIND
jgi:hypothetical protein